MTFSINNNYWTFIETFYPNYNSCDQILLSDILARKLEVIDIKEQLLQLDTIIMQKALKNYFEIKYSKKTIIEPGAIIRFKY